MTQGEERKKMRFSELVEHVTKKPIPPWKKHLLVEVTVTDEEDEDVEVSTRTAQTELISDLICLCSVQVPFIIIRI